MLQIVVPAGKEELWNEDMEEFIYAPVGKDTTLTLEHSLISLSKWESKWCKPFFSKEPKTKEEVVDYVKCMTLTPNVSPEVYERLSDDNFQDVDDYIKAPMTATTFSNQRNGKPNREIITAELVYYWMIALNIPFECQKWHLNRLITLIQVCEIKNNPPKKMGKAALMRRNASLNAARKQQLHTKG